MARRERRRRRVAAVVAIAAGLVAVVSGLAMLSGGRSSSEPPPADRSVTVPGSEGPPAADPGVAVGSAPSTGGARTPGGAARAATVSLVELQSLLLADPDTRRAALERIVAPDADELVAGTLEAMTLVDQAVAEARDLLPAARVLVREVPVSYRVAAFEPGAATVRVWSVGVVLIEGRTEASEVWSTNSVELAWLDGGWRVRAWTRQAGPTPAVIPAEPASPSEVLDAVGGWEEYRYEPAR